MGKITIVGVGFAEGQLTQGAEEALLSGAKVILHTDHCPCADWLKEKNIVFSSLDSLYEDSEDFDEHAEDAAQEIFSAAEDGDVVYAVLDVRDRSVGEILRHAPAQVIPGPPVEDALFACAEGPTLLLEASDWEDFRLQAAQNTIVRELDNRELASEVKLKLMDCYPEEMLVYVRLPEGGIAQTELYNLDRLEQYDHRTAVLVPACKDPVKLERFGFEDLMRIVERLRAPGGCPWDRRQTHETLRSDLIEEAYEVAEAIDNGDEGALLEELGDILFGVVLHTEIARAHGEFEMQDVTSEISEKMIRRHPHVFAGAKAPQMDEISGRWQEIKRQEYDQTSRAQSMRAVAKALPALVRAEKVLKRAENADELMRVAAEQDGADIGRALLALVARAMQQNASAEELLAESIGAYIDDFAARENGGEQ